MGIYYYRKGINILESTKENEDYNLKNIEALLKENLKSSNLCFLIGSGCSVGAIALMSKTFKDIKSKLSDKEKEVLGKYNDSDDIEGCLNWLNKGIEFLENAANDSRRNYQECFNSIKKGLINSIDINYSEKNSKKILKIYQDFFNGIFEERVVQSTPINIFTTNYDLFNEKALESLKIEYSNGFSGYVDRVFSPYSFNYRIVDEENRYKDKWSPIKKYVRLYKIHGSIDWIYEDNKIIQTSNFKRKENRTLIYPLQTKHYDTQQTPYSELFREMNIKLQKRNTTLIVIGYGFPDEHINNLISQSLENNDFNLIIFSDIKEKNPKKFYNLHKDKPNLHFIGGDLENGEKLHYFENIVKLLKYENKKEESL